MNEIENTFAMFPRAKLSLKVSRRRFFSIFFANVKNYAEQEHYNGAGNLAQLGILSNEELAEIIPQVLSGSQVKLDNCFVWVTAPDADNPIQLFPVDSPALFVFNQFNGQNFLIDVVSALTQHTGWNDEYAFVYTRGVFLTLVVAGICIPTFLTK